VGTAQQRLCPPYGLERPLSSFFTSPRRGEVDAHRQMRGG
jgi:hypothetical protein